MVKRVVDSYSCGCYNFFLFTTIMMQDKIFTNYAYRAISYATKMYFWNSTFQAKLPKLRDIIKKEIEP